MHTYMLISLCVYVFVYIYGHVYIHKHTHCWLYTHCATTASLCLCVRKVFLIVKEGKEVGLLSWVSVNDWKKTRHKKRQSCQLTKWNQSLFLSGFDPHSVSGPSLKLCSIRLYCRCRAALSSHSAARQSSRSCWPGADYRSLAAEEEVRWDQGGATDEEELRLHWGLLLSVRLICVSG